MSALRPGTVALPVADVGLADWEHPANPPQAWNLAYSPASAPGYFMVYFPFFVPPEATSYVNSIPRDPRTTSRRGDLIDCRFDCFLRTGPGPGGANTFGIMWAALGWYTTSPQTVQPPVDFGNSFPPYTNGLPDVSESYDPVELPVGGVNYPIYTRQNIDTLTIRRYVRDSDNQSAGDTSIAPAAGQYLWAFIAVQINGNLQGAGAATLAGRWHWRPTPASIAAQ